MFVNSNYMKVFKLISDLGFLNAELYFNNSTIHYLISEIYQAYLPTLARIIFNAPPALNHSICWSLYE